MRPKVYDDIRVTTSVRISADSLRIAKENDINLSAVLEGALNSLLEPNKLREAQAKRLEFIAEREKEVAQEREKAREEFNLIGKHVVYSGSALKYWSKRTGFSTSELIKLKGGE